MKRLLVALAVLFPVYASAEVNCDNNGRCVTTGSKPAHVQTVRAKRHQRHVADANGNEASGAGYVVSKKTGARARVGLRYVATFQAYVDDLESNHGSTIYYMGGLRPGRCALASQHPCGRALDVCQRRRGVVDAKCHLPGRRELAAIASRHGLFEGGRWCSSDYGHAQVGETSPDCGSRFASMRRRDRATTMTISAH